MIFIFLTPFLFGFKPELDFADTLFQKGLYEAAIADYQRFIYYNFSSPDLNYARYKLALSYLKRNQEDDRLKGERILREVAFNLETDDTLIKKMATSSLIRYCIDIRNYEMANWVINSIPLEEEEFRHWQSLLLIREGKINTAKDLVKKSGDTLLFHQIKDLKLPKKEWLATAFSILLPGTGEIYSGKYKEGLTSILVNGLSAYGIYYSLRAKRNLDAILIFSFFFLRFYPGSIQNAFRFAREYNEDYLERRLAKRR